jgi:hypothetical protein
LLGLKNNNRTGQGGSLSAKALLALVAGEGDLDFFSEESGGKIGIGIGDPDFGQDVGFVYDGDVLHLAISGEILDRLVEDGGRVVSSFNSQMSADELRGFGIQYGNYVQDL